MNLLDHVCLVLGGARMGSSVGRRLSECGATILFGWRRSRAAAQTQCQEIIALGGRADTLPLNLSDVKSIDRAVRWISRKCGRLDIVVNLASSYDPTPFTGGASEEGWDSQMDPNAKGAYLLTRSVGPLVSRSPRGRIIHVSDWTSASARPRYKDYSAYYVSKLAVKGVVETAALEWAPRILINAIAPGPMLPPSDLSKREVAAVSRATPVGRWGGADEIAKAVMFLVETDFVTGETIRVDGGRHLI